MALIMFTGFETGDINTAELWNNCSGTPSVNSASPRSGTGTYYASSPTSGQIAFSDTSLLSQQWAPATETLYMGCAFRRGSSSDICWITMGCNGGTGALHYCELKINGDGSIELSFDDDTAAGSNPTTVGTSIASVIGTDWHYIELQYWPDQTSGRLKVLVDGVVPTVNTGSLDFTGDTQTDTTRTAANVALIFNGNTGDTFDVDDIYLCTDTASGNDPFTGLMGEQCVEALVPTSDSSIAWTRSTGANSYALVDEIPPSMTDYVETTTATDEDIYGLGNTTLSGTANAVSVTLAALQNTVTTGQVRCEVNSSASTTNGATHNLALARKDFVDFFPVDPNGSGPWSNSAVDAATVSIYCVAVT